MWQPLIPRRQFLGQTAAVAGGLAAFPALAQEKTKRPRIAAVFTELRFRSHAFNILENFLGPYLFDGKLVDPGVDVVSFYADQFPENDMARGVAKKYKIPLFQSIDQAMCAGGKSLDVDGVLLIGEHGDYPANERGQKMYPRKQFFDQCVAPMHRAGRYVPLFNDKHLSYRWDWAKEMYDTARKHGFPLLAGSSVPLASRVPELNLPPDVELEEAVSIHGGGLESYDFHGLEVLQSFVEARRGGETGVARVELLTGEALAKAEKAGRWSQALVAAAMSGEAALAERRQPRPDAAQRQNKLPDTAPDNPQKIRGALLLTYRDGFQASVLQMGSSSNRWNFACRVKGERQPRATCLFNSPWGNRGLFKALSHAIQVMFLTGQEPYPVERTLLTTGLLDAAMHSHAQGGQPVETPQLAISYQPKNFQALRETGKSWQFITKASPQPTEFLPGSDRQWVQ